MIPRRDMLVAPAEHKPRTSFDRGGHVILLDGGGFKCERCGRFYVMGLPAPLDVWIAAGEAFVRLHRGCPKPEAQATAAPAAAPKKRRRRR